MKLLIKNERGLSLVETVIAVSMIAILGTLGIITYSFLKNVFLKDELNLIAASAYSKALEADTGFDEEQSAETVIEELSEEYPEFDMRTSGEGYDNLCVFVSHEDLPGHEAINGSCIEAVIKDRPASAQPIAVQNLQCFDHSTDTRLHNRQFKLTWDTPATLRGRDVVYTIKWIEHITNVQGEFITTDTEYTHTAPVMNRSGMPFTPSTELIIVPEVDGVVFETTPFASRDDGKIANTRLCGGGDI